MVICSHKGCNVIGQWKPVLIVDGYEATLTFFVCEQHKLRVKDILTPAMKRNILELLRAKKNVENVDWGTARIEHKRVYVFVTPKA